MELLFTSYIWAFQLLICRKWCLYLCNVFSAGIWIHCGGYMTSSFDSNGYVIGTDNGNTLINDLSRFLDAAKVNDILVIPVLWNWAIYPAKQEMLNLIWDEGTKLQSYINNALKPMVRALKDKVYWLHWQCLHAMVRALKDWLCWPCWLCPHFNGQGSLRYEILTTLTMSSNQLSEYSKTRYIDYIDNSMVRILKDKWYWLHW